MVGQASSLSIMKDGQDAHLHQPSAFDVESVAVRGSRGYRACPLCFRIHQSTSALRFLVGQNDKSLLYIIS